MQNNQLSHGVIQDNMLVYSVVTLQGARQLRRVNLPHLTMKEQLFSLALEHHLTHLWVVPGCALNRWTVDRVYSDDEWDLQLTTATNDMGPNAPDLITGITAKRRRDRVMIRIVYPQSIQTYGWIPDDDKPLDPVACLAAIHYIHEALGTIHQHPGVAGRLVMMQENNSSARQAWLRPCSFDPIAELGHHKRAQDVGWIVPIAEHQSIGWLPEQTGWLRAWDKNSQYLAAATSCALGTGDPVHFAPEYWRERPDEAFRLAYDGIKPGYWHVNVKECAPFSPLYRSKTDHQEWITTPLLRLLIRMQAQFTIVDAFVWPEHHRILDTFAVRVWTARQELKNNHQKYPHAAGRQLAYDSIKRIAVAAPGLLSNEKVKQFMPTWYRPDWYEHLREEAKARLLYQVLKIWHATKALPRAAVVDALYYLEAPDLIEQISAFFEGKDQKLGGWKIIADMPITPGVRDAFKPGMAPGRMSGALKRLQSQEHSLV